MATRSSMLAWRIPETEEPGGLLSMGSQSRTRLKRLSSSSSSSLCCCTGFSLVVEGGGYSLAMVPGFLIAVASLAAEHRLQGFSGCSMWAQQLWSRGLVALGTWDLLGSGIEPMSSAWGGRFFITEPPGKPHNVFYDLISKVTLYHSCNVFSVLQAILIQGECRPHRT